MWEQRRFRNKRLRIGSKYHNIAQEYNGRIYHSKMEADYAFELDLRKKSGEIKKWIPQYKVSLDIKRKGQKYHIANYYVDFLVINSDNSKEFHECKGFETEVWKIKWRLTEALYSNKYTMVLIK